MNLTSKGHQVCNRLPLRPSSKTSPQFADPIEGKNFRPEVLIWRPPLKSLIVSTYADFLIRLALTCRFWSFPTFERFPAL